jgi:triacylglycerol lipase
VRLPASEYDPRTAIFLAAVCHQAYMQLDDPSRFVVPENYTCIETLQADTITGAKELFGFILSGENRVIIAFRGTSTAADWVADALASQRRYKCVKGAGQTHRGISDIYDSMRKVVLASLLRFPDCRSLWITGHSLGGALATLCALDAASNTSCGIPVVYTYGSPRVGDPEFAQAYSKTVGESSFRFYNLYDFVPLMPPNVYKLPKNESVFRYMHVKQGVQLQFKRPTVAGNHYVDSYFAELSKKDPVYTEELRARSPGFCPETLVH